MQAINFESVDYKASEIKGKNSRIYFINNENFNIAKIIHFFARIFK